MQLNFGTQPASKRPPVSKGGTQLQGKISLQGFDGRVNLTAYFQNG